MIQKWLNIVVVVTFDTFEAFDDSVDYYETAPTAEATDTIGIIAYSVQQILRKNSPIKNVVLDLSCNTGGVIFMTMTIDELAAQASLSRSYFQHTYKKLFGKSVTEDIISSRLEYAKMLLATTDSSVKDIAAKCGYDNDVHFMRQFIVFIEYGVNDAQDMFTKSSYESLVKTLLTQENEPAVVLLFNRTVDGYSA